MNKEEQARTYSFAEFTRPMEILSGLDDKRIRDIRAHISLITGNTYLAGYEAAESRIKELELRLESLGDYASALEEEREDLRLELRNANLWIEDAKVQFEILLRAK